MTSFIKAAFGGQDAGRRTGLEASGKIGLTTVEGNQRVENTETP